MNFLFYYSKIIDGRYILFIINEKFKLLLNKGIMIRL
jgi:hypothetical protein